MFKTEFVLEMSKNRRGNRKLALKINKFKNQRVQNLLFLAKKLNS